MYPGKTREKLNSTVKTIMHIPFPSCSNTIEIMVYSSTSSIAAYAISAVLRSLEYADIVARQAQSALS